MQQKAEQRSSEPATAPECETVSVQEEDSADLWVEKYKPKSYLELLSDEVSASSTAICCRAVSAVDEGATDIMNCSRELPVGSFVSLACVQTAQNGDSSGTAQAIDCFADGYINLCCWHEHLPSAWLSNI
jgi:hypothetical protein